MTTTTMQGSGLTLEPYQTESEVAIELPLIYRTPTGVRVIYPDRCSRRFIKDSWWDTDALEALLGLDKPKTRIKSITK